MFGELPAYGFYCRHVKGLRFSGIRLQTDAPDLRHATLRSSATISPARRPSRTFRPGCRRLP